MSLSYHKVIAQAPSNIAFVKYWGKYGRQYPMNPSISMTLKKCLTEMEVEYCLDSNLAKITSFEFEGEQKPNFKKKFEQYLEDIEDIFPLSKRLSLKIKSKNTFPHSAGIASSASAMAAFATVLCEIEANVNVSEFNITRASMLARLGSGSACRSVFPNYSVWGDGIEELGSNESGVEFKNFHESFSSLEDTILIVSKDTKAISSSMGHQLMHGHSFREARCDQAKENLHSLIAAMESGDFKTFGEVLENEALTLHALMMTSYPSFILLKPESLSVIDLIRIGRSELGIPMYFTIDAGPNIHLIYPSEFKARVKEFLEQSVSDFCESIIYDQIGNGSEILK